VRRKGEIQDKRGPKFPVVAGGLQRLPSEEGETEADSINAREKQTKAEGNEREHEVTEGEKR